MLTAIQRLLPTMTHKFLSQCNTAFEEADLGGILESRLSQASSGREDGSLAHTRLTFPRVVAIHSQAGVCYLGHFHYRSFPSHEACQLWTTQAFRLPWVFQGPVTDPGKPPNTNINPPFLVFGSLLALQARGSQRNRIRSLS